MVTIAQIGIGYWGPNLLRNLVANRHCRVKTVVDVAPGRREFVEALYPGIATTPDSDAVLSDPEIDAIIIATPVATHFDLALKVLQQGKHALVEKPMARTAQEVEQIQSLATDNQLVAMAGHTFIYNAAVRYLKKLVEEETLGHIRYISSQRLNLGRIRTDVDALWNFAPHDVSIIQYLLGDPQPLQVSSQGMDFVQEGIADVVFLHISYPNKIMAHVHVSWLDPHKVRRMTIVGSKKMAVYDDMAENKIAIYDKGIEPRAILGENMDFDHPDFTKFHQRSGDVLLPKIDFVEPLQTEVEHFLECIRNRTPCLTGPAHALQVVRILSDADGCEVGETR